MAKNMRKCSMTVIAAALTALTALPATAASVADFYKDKTVTIVVPAGMGGSIGLYALLFSHHIGKHIPGKPTVITQSHPGSSGVKAASYVYNAAPRNGTVIAQLLSNSLLAPVLRRAKFDPLKFQWLGTISPRASVIGVWHTAPAQTLDQIKKTEIVLASGGKSASTTIVPLMMNKMLGTKFKIVTGYRGGGNLNKAVEQGEVHGRYIFWTGWVTRKPHWIKKGLIKVLVQVGPRIPELPNIPSLSSLVKNPEHRQMLDFMGISERVGLAFWMAQQVPKDRFRALRTAFAATMKDPAFIAEAKKRNAPIDTRTGQQVTRIVNAGYNIPPAVAAKMKAMVGLGGAGKKKRK
jgi:tripartite-type tricarboxylate transporter receptor subunit TctC